MKTDTYRIVVTDYGNDFLEFVRENKFDGYLHPNQPEGNVWELELTEDMLLLLALKFNPKTYFKIKN